MSTEQGEGSTSQAAASRSQNPTETTEISERPSNEQSSVSELPSTLPSVGDGQANSGESSDASAIEGQPPTIRERPSDSTSSTATSERPVIAVSASKGPPAFFNLARKFLVTDEFCDLSALEGAIVSAVDAAHLLERSKLAKIVRVETSYVVVEPKRRRQSQNQPPRQLAAHGGETSRGPAVDSSSSLAQPPRGRSGGSSGRVLHRARIVITVRRTENYTQWLRDYPLAPENPLHQAIVTGDEEDTEVNREADPGKKAPPS